jgi:uncharacterized protein (UPF0335 family)
MIKAQLRDYIERVTQEKQIRAEDVRDLQRDVLPHGLTTRLEAETLLALDRLVPADATWREALTALIVDFVVWGARPTGRVTADDASWLAAALDAGTPTETAMRIAHAVVAEAEQVDEALLSFILRGRRKAPVTAAA